MKDRLPSRFTRVTAGRQVVLGALSGFRERDRFLVFLRERSPVPSSTVTFAPMSSDVCARGTSIVAINVSPPTGIWSEVR